MTMEDDQIWSVRVKNWKINRMYILISIKLINGYGFKNITYR